MSYRIDYGPSRRQNKAGGKIFFCLFSLLLVTVLCIHFFWPAGSSFLYSVLLPGDSAVTRQAAEGFLSHIRDGQPLGDALLTFCRDILSGGELA